jgi:hypothetical protein
LFAPAVLFAAGSFTGTAHAAVFVESIDAPSSANTRIAIGVPIEDAQFSYVTFKDGQFSSAILNAAGSAGTFNEGDLSMTPYIPDGMQTFATSVKTFPTGGYFALRFNVGEDTYYGYATASSGMDITQITYEAPSRLSVAVSRAVPEPATWAEMILGLGVAGAAMRRRRQTAALSA